MITGMFGLTYWEPLGRTAESLLIQSIPVHHTERAFALHLPTGYTKIHIFEVI